MSEEVCAVENCNEPATVDITVKEGEQTYNVKICQKCWEDLNFNNVLLKFKPFK